MIESQFHAKLQRGYDDYSAGRTQNAAAAFSKMFNNALSEVHIQRRGTAKWKKSN